MLDLVLGLVYLDVVLGYLVLVGLDLSVGVVQSVGCGEDLGLEGFDAVFEPTDVVADGVILGDEGVHLGLGDSLVFYGFV